jgi:hypothetical protein
MMRARRRPKRSMRRKTKHLVLPRPFRWQVGEASNAHAVGEPAIDGRFDEIGCKEGKRDCHVNLSHAAVFALRDAIRACCWITDKFIKPATAAGNRCHQSGACLGTDRASVLRPNPLGQKNLTAPPCGCLLPRDLKSAWRLGKMDDQPVCLDLDAGDVSMDETAVFNGLTV